LPGTEVRGEKHVTVVHLRALYDCAAICQREGGDEGDPAVRAACRCSLPGFDSSRWDPAAHPRAAAEVEGKLLTLEAHAAKAGFALDHVLDRDGCPRGWADSHFGASVMRYAGTRSCESPMRSLNIRLQGRVMRDEEPPTRLLDLVDYGIAAEDNALAYYHEVVRRS
jgi:hypothetical protein